MKNHIWRPLWLALSLALLLIIVRQLVVPKDFAAHERGYMYGWHRKSNESEWQKFPISYRTSSGCKECHPDIQAHLSNSPHATINCENCHGPALEHPKDTKGYSIDRSRLLCLRCHAKLPYINSARGRIRGIDPDQHYSQAECVMCHIPHNPKPVNQKREVTS